MENRRWFCVYESPDVQVVTIGDSQREAYDLMEKEIGETPHLNYCDFYFGVKMNPKVTIEWTTEV